MKEFFDAVERLSLPDPWFSPEMISQLKIVTHDCAATARIYEVICGTSAQFHSSSRCSLSVHGSLIELEEIDTVGKPDIGIQEIRVHESDLESAERRLSRAAVKYEISAEGICIDPSEACNLRLILSNTPPQRSGNATSRLDHIALRVFDLEASGHRWAAMLGVAAQMMGVHPVSNGAFEATRFLIGDQMIELVAPVPGVDSAIAQRLNSHGEGVATLAVPAVDVEHTIASLQQSGVEVLWRDPHWMVHPRDASGVLVQLTPRVAH